MNILCKIFGHKYPQDMPLDCRCLRCNRHVAEVFFTDLKELLGEKKP